MTTRFRLSILLATAALVLALSAPVFAQRLPDYYPDSFQRTGTVDDIQNDRIVVSDIPYALAGELVVHTLSERDSFLSHIRRGAKIGFTVGQNRQIVEIWQLPDNYDDSAGRR